jgi:hypothetical protein
MTKYYRQLYGGATKNLLCLPQITVITVNLHNTLPDHKMALYSLYQEETYSKDKCTAVRSTGKRTNGLAIRIRLNCIVKV